MLCWTLPSTSCLRFGELSWRIQALLSRLLAIVTPDNEVISAARPASPRIAATRRRGARRPIAAILASFAVVAFAGAMIAPAGSAFADPVAEEDTVTAYSLAASDTQNLTVAVEGTDLAPAARGTFELYVKPKPKPKPKPVPATTSASESSSGSAPIAAPRYSGGGSKEQWMSAAGIPSSNWGFVDSIVSRESGWNPNATNSSSGACGLVQIYPCSKVANAYDPVVNLTWGNNYANSRYGSWANAYAFWQRNHWW